MLEGVSSIDPFEQMEHDWDGAMLKCNPIKSEHTDMKNIFLGYQ